MITFLRVSPLRIIAAGTYRAITVIYFFLKLFP